MGEVVKDAEIVEPKYELLEVRPDGTEVRRYFRDGSIRDQRGRTLEISPNLVEHKLTPETAPRILAIRRQKYVEAIEEGLSSLSERRVPHHVVAEIVKKRARVALTDDGHAGNDAARLILQILDLMPRREGESVVTHEYTIDPETKKFLVEMAEIMRERGE